MRQSEVRPVSGAQAGIWYGQQSSSDQGGYSTAQCLEFQGALDVALLARAAQRALNEADSPFEGFVETETGPGRCGRASPMSLPEIVDLRHRDDARAHAFQEMARRRLAPFDVVGGSLARQALFRLADDHALWWLNLHHLAADAWAYALIQQRAAEHYVAMRKGGEARACWYGQIDAVIEEERRYLESPALERDRTYWRERLVGAPAPVSPAGRFALASAQSIRRERHLESGPSARFQSQCEKQKLGLAEAIMAAGGAFHARLCGRSDVTLGVPMMGRMQGAALKTPMTQVNMLPLRLESSFDATPRTWCLEAGAELGALRRHQRYRHEWLLRDLGRRPGRQPLLGMHVNVLPFDPVGQWPDCRVEKHHLVAGPVEDLVLSVYLGGDGDRMRLALDANPALYDERDVEAHLARLAEWLPAFVETPDRPLCDMSLLSEHDRSMLTRFNATDHPVERTHMATLFERQVAATPDRTALCAQGQCLDYRTLGRRVEALSRRLIVAGLLPGDTVGVALSRSVEMEVALLAIHHAGGAWLPLPLAYPDARLGDMIGRAAPTLLVTQHAEQARLSDLSPVAPIVVDALETVKALEEAETPLVPVAAESPRRDPALAAYVLFTSGSTGRPKGVAVEHHAIVNRILWMQAAYPLGFEDRVLQKTSNGFDVSVWEFLWPVISGATLVMAREGGHREPRYLIDTMIAERITTLHFVPSMLEIFLDELTERDAADLGALRRVIVSGEALTPALEKRFMSCLPGVALENLYGPTEAAVDVSAWHCDGDPACASIPIGRPIWNTRLHVLDERLDPVPVGMSGELYIAGRNLARGYLGQPELTDERFIEQGELEPRSRLYRTGDLARWRHDGALEYLGRIDQQIKLRGQRLEPGEIEAVLLSHSSVSQAVVVAFGSGGETRLVGYAVPAPQAVIDQALLKQHLARHLPDYMVPGAILSLETLPLGATGKLDRRALPTPDQRGGAPVGEDLPASPRQQLMADIFAEVLGLARVGVRDNFFDLGGHSLSALRLSRRIGEALGERLSVAALFESPTVEALDGAIGAAGERQGLGGVLSLRPTGHRPPLFCIHPAGGLAWCYAGLARVVPADYPLYGVQARGLARGETLPANMAAMARDYIEQLRPFKPAGPWCLMGWSVGGMVAHTMAAQLEAEGEEVALLALLDAYPADLWRHMTPPDEAMALGALLRIAGIEPPDESGLCRDRVIELLAREGSAMGQLAPATLDALVDVVINNSRLVRETRHPRFGGDMHFFTAAAPRKEHWLDWRAWQPLVGGRIVNLDIPATHPQLIQTPHLGRIGEEIARLLEAVPGARERA